MSSFQDELNRKVKDIFVKHFAQLVEAIDDPLLLATKLREKGLISRSLFRRLELTKGGSQLMTNP